MTTSERITHMWKREEILHRIDPWERERPKRRYRKRRKNLVKPARRLESTRDERRRATLAAMEGRR